MLTKPEISILIDVLARTDALFGIPRTYNPSSCLPPHCWAAVAERRAAFVAEGIHVVTSGNAQSRKEAERLFGELQTRGLLVVFSKSGRRIGVRLTVGGDNIARHFACQPLLHESWPWLAEIAGLVAAGVSWHQSVRETDIAGCEYGDAEISGILSNLEMSLLPLAAAGLVRDNCDRRGRVWYALTSAGESAATQPAPETPELPPYSDKFWSKHSTLEKRYLAERLTWEPSRPNSIFIPMSCGIGPTKTWRDIAETAAK